MSVLTREELRAALASVPPLVEDVDPHLQLQPNGIDLRVERVQRLTSPGAARRRRHGARARGA